ncbi:MAG TPA: hypothetical protein DCZ23_06230 [Lachnospiraceae bacterium]|nr:hypothetical protein [Lachnospiraceae bacterium]
MNSAKKLINQKDKPEKNPGSTGLPAANNRVLGDGGGGSGRKPVILGAICAVVVLVLCAGVGIQQLKPQRVLIVKDTKMTMDDMMYPIYERESQYLPLDETYQYMMGQSVWDVAYQGSDSSVESGTSNSDGLKLEIINAETEYEILYQEAKNAQYELTDDERSEAEKQADDALKGLTTVQKLKLDISKNKLSKRFEKRILADRYKADQQEILNKDVDEAAAIADISKEDNRQYDIEYYYAPLTSTDSDGNASELSKSDKKALAEKIKALAKKAATAEDFSKLIEDEEKSDIKHDTGNFTETAGWTYVSDKNLKKIKALENGKISSVFIDDAAGYYVFVKMINNNSTEAYDNECEAAVSAAQKAKYEEWYNSLKESYNTEVNNEIWDTVTIGGVTTGIVTAEDLQKMNEEASSGTSE